MKMKLIVILLMLVKTSFSVERHCRGSDGPTPFTKIPAPQLEAIATTDSVSSFVILEKRNQMAYVGSKGNLWIHDFENKAEINLGKFRGSLAPFIDPDERFLFSGNLGLMKDIRAELNPWEFKIPQDASPLFWFQRELFILEKVSKVSSGIWNVTHSRVDSDSQVVRRHSCQLSLPPNVQLGLGHGHLFPSVLFYGYQYDKGRSYLDLYQLNVLENSKKCDFRQIVRYEEPIFGKIQSVTQLNEAREYAIVTDHPQRDLLYDTERSCAYYSLPSGVSYFPNPRIPVLVNVNRQKGVGLFALHTGKQFTIDRSVDAELSLKNHVWINSQSPDLFIALREQSKDRERKVYHLNVDSLLGK